MGASRTPPSSEACSPGHLRPRVGARPPPCLNDDPRIVALAAAESCLRCCDLTVHLCEDHGLGQSGTTCMGRIGRPGRHFCPATGRRHRVPSGSGAASGPRSIAGRRLEQPFGSRAASGDTSPCPWTTPFPLPAAHCTTNRYAHCIRSTPCSMEWRWKMPFHLAACGWKP